MEIDKVCRGLECLIQMTSCVGCPYWDSGRTRKDCLSHIGEDAIALLKERGAVKPILGKTGRIWLCGNCGSYVGFEDNDPHDPNEYDKYCRECGRPVL